LPAHAISCGGKKKSRKRGKCAGKKTKCPLEIPVAGLGICFDGEAMAGIIERGW